MNSLKRYYGFSEYLNNRFACRVYKITVDAGFSCPNRDGTRGRGGCIYCDNRGFSVNTRIKSVPVEDQIKKGLEFSLKRYDAKKFLLYFQAYTNTYAPLEVLKKNYDIIKKFDNIIGLCIGTRPDCVNDEILDLIEKYTDDYEVWVEYGLQSIHDRTLKLINRNHTYKDFLGAVELTRKKNNIKICAHVIIGLPGESQKEVLDTARELGNLKINAIKIHPLHIIKGTKLEEIYNKGEYHPLSLEEYTELTSKFLEYLCPETVIQRITANCPNEYLAAPGWIKNKNQVLKKIDDMLKEKDRYQGKLFNVQNQKF